MKNTLLRSMQRLTKLVLGGVAAVLVASPVLAQDGRLAEIIKRDKLIVATFGTAPPFGYTDEKGELVGFDIDIARLIAKSMLGDENKVEFVAVASEGRWPAVNSGRADIGVAATTVYPDRALRVGFTRPYIDSGVSVLVRKDLNIESLKALNSSEFTLANLDTTQMLDRQQRFLPDVQVLTFDTPNAMFAAVKSGQASAAQMDTPSVNWYAVSNDWFDVLPGNIAALEGYAIFMKQGDFPLWLWMDTMVQEMLAGSRYEEYSEIYRKWFGKNPPPQRFYK